MCVVSVLSVWRVCALGGQNRLLGSVELEVQVVEREPPDVRSGLQTPGTAEPRLQPSLKYS